MKVDDQPTWKREFGNLLTEFNHGAEQFPGSRMLVAKVKDSSKLPKVWDMPFFTDRNAFTYPVSNSTDSNALEYLYVMGTETAMNLFDTLMRMCNPLLPHSLIPKDPIHSFSSPVNFDPMGNWVRLVFHCSKDSGRRIHNAKHDEIEAVWLDANPFEASAFTIEKMIMQ